jgi:hypothetical protein
MALCATMVLATLAPKDDDLWPAGLAHDFCADGSPLNAWCTHSHLVAITKHDNVIKNDFSTLVGGNALNKDFVIFCHAVLLTACLYQRIHGFHP